jgi:hypothetical protein
MSTDPNGKVLFGGFDTSGNFGLWVTNGTGAGTYELQISTAYAGGLFFVLTEILPILPFTTIRYSSTVMTRTALPVSG